MKEANAYKTAFDKAAELLRTADPAALSLRTGARWQEERLLVPFFDQICTIELPAVRFAEAALSLYEQILILHYVTSSGVENTRGEWVKFKNLPGASFYDPTYRKRSTNRILAAFGDQPKQLLEAAAAVSGRPADFGDVSVELDIFPKVKAVVVLYRGDDEFPPEAGILFRDDIVNYLPLEDIAVCAGLLAGRLAKASSG